MKNLFKKYFTISILSLLTVVSACNKKEIEPELEGPITLKLINALDGSAPQDFYQNLMKLSVAPIVYGEESTTVTAVSGYKRLTFANAGTMVETIGIDVSILAQTSFNVFLSKTTAGDPAIYGFENDRVIPEAGKVKVRFLNLGATLSNRINVNSSAGAVLQSDLEFKVPSSYLLLDAGLNMNAVVIGSLDATAIDGSSLLAGNNYTIWFDAENATKVKYFITKDN